MRTRIVTITAALVLLSATLAAGQSGYDLFQQALLKERSEANLPEAIRIYERIVKDFSSNRPLVAKTLMQLGAAYEKQNDKQKARSAYETVARTFATEAEMVAEARRRLAILDGTPADEGVRIRVAATGDDADADAFITPDGRFLVRPDWDTGDLAVRDMVLGKPTRMMAKSGDFNSGEDKNTQVEQAIMSPDRKWIVYLWFTWTTPGDVHYELRIMPNQVGGKSRVLFVSPEYNFFQLIGWTPDAKWVFCVLYKQDGTRAFAQVGSDGSKTVKTLRSMGWRLGTGRPSLSPDGKFVAYSALPTDPGKQPTYPQPVKELEEQHLYLLPTDGSGNETELVRGANINESPLWTQDGSRILFVSNRSGSFGLWSVEVKDGKLAEGPSPVRTSIAGRIQPVGITDKGSLYYLPPRSDSLGTDVFVARMDARTGQVTGPLSRALDNFADWNRSPSWSPDGKAIAFLRQRPVTEDRAPNDPDAFTLVVFEAESGNEKEYRLSYIDPASPPLWFHDGKSLLVKRRYNSGQLYRLDLASGEFRSIEALAHSLLPAGWQSAVPSPDGSVVYLSVRIATTNASSVMWEVVSFDLTTAEVKHLWKSADSLRGILRFTLSPDGQSLALVLRQQDWESPRLLRVKLDKGDTHELARSVTLETLAWSSSGIYFVRDGDQQLMRIPAGGTKPELTGIVLGGTAPVSVNADGTRIIFSRNTRADGELYVMENLPSLWKSTLRK